MGMYLHGSEAFDALAEQSMDSSLATSLTDVPRRSLFTAIRSASEVVADSVMVVVFVMAAAFALSTIEGIIESHAPQTVEAAEISPDAEARVPWINSLLGIQTALASPMQGYEALPISVPSKVTMTPGETKTVTATFQNSGSKSWGKSGDGYVSVYTYVPKYRTSVFQSSTWIGPTQLTKLKESTVAVGAVGTVQFALTAPTKEGTYTEAFQLASESTAWIPGGAITLTITVAATPTKSTTTTPASTSTSSTSVSRASSYQATVTSLGESSITAKGGISVVYSVSVKNTGTATWQSRNLKPDTIQMADVSANDISHKSWKSSSLVLKRTGSIAPGDSDTFSFAFTAPKYKGNYDLKFQLSTDDQVIEGGEIDIPVDVTSDAPGVKDAPSKNKEKKTKKKPKVSSEVYTEHITIDEPTIRVGVLIVDEETDDEIVISAPCEMDVTDEAGNVLITVDVGEEVTAYYSTAKKKYYYEVDGEKEKVATPIRFVPSEENAILTVTNFDRRVTRGSSNADNQFRNILEIRHNDVKERTWLINELKMETYLKGLAETSNISPAEFQKTLITAARTYAYYHWQRNTKHDAEGFTVDAYADQVYKGYGQEARTPNLSAAVDATRGVTVVYNGETAITAYFSRSAGKTLDWSDVWGGDVPWCKSVPVPWDEGKTLWGHGVGMSASGALGAANDGWGYDKILKYFYTGVDLEKRWK